MSSFTIKLNYKHIDAQVLINGDGTNDKWIL